VIDWNERIKHLRRMSAELEQQALRTQGRERLIIGRIADELHDFATDIARELALEEGYSLDESPYDEEGDIPGWLDQPTPATSETDPGDS